MSKEKCMVIESDIKREWRETERTTVMSVNSRSMMQRDSEKESCSVASDQEILCIDKKIEIDV